MKSHSDVIKELGGYLAVAEALDLPKGTVSSMITRDSIPPEHWPAVVSEAAKLGKADITMEQLASMRPARPKRSSAPAPEPTS